MAKQDYYIILKVTREVSDDELKKAFRRLAIEHHPDKNPGDKAAEDKFKEINEAYQILSNPKTREAYDRFGHAGVNAGAGGFGQGFGAGGFSDIFDNIFGDIFGGGQGGSNAGIDLRYNLEITFEEAAFGCEKEIKFEKEATCDGCSGSGAKEGSRPKTCQTCRGTGQVRFNQGFFTLSRPCGTCSGRGSVIEHVCPKCRGRGRSRAAHAIKVPIPAGIDTDQRIRLRGEGEISEPGGPAGDLYVQMRVAEHPLFRRESEHVILELPIHFAQAALGAEIEVPTLQGATKLSVSAGTQSGAVLRLKGKGIKRLNGSGYGDQLIQLIIETPTKLTPKQRELLRQFEEETVIESNPGIFRFLEKVKELFKP